MSVYDNGKGVTIVKKLLLLVVVVQSHTHKGTKLCVYIDFHMKMCIGITFL